MQLMFPRIRCTSKWFVMVRDRAIDKFVPEWDKTEWHR